MEVDYVLKKLRKEPIESRFCAEVFGDDDGYTWRREWRLESEEELAAVAYANPHDPTITLALTTRFILVKKTDEELAAERVEDILRRNTQVAICITCNGPIREHDPIINSRHGAYHGAPWTCVNGR